MNFQAHRTNFLVYTALIYISATVLSICMPQPAYGGDKESLPPVRSSSAWISNVHFDADDNEVIAVLNVWDSDPKAYVLTEYVRRTGMTVNPDMWTPTKTTRGQIGEHMTISKKASILTLAFEQDEMKWPLEYHRHSDRDVLPDRDIAGVLRQQADAIGQWMSYAVDDEMKDPLIWTLSITEEDTFELRMYSYDQQAVPDGWSLMLKLVGDVGFSPGFLGTERVYNVPAGSLEQWRGETPLLEMHIEVLHNQKADLLIVVFPPKKQGGRPSMVLTFHRCLGQKKGS